MKLTLFLVTVLVLAGCHKTDPAEKIHKTAIDMHEFEEDLIVPSSLWKAIEKIYRPLALDPEAQAQAIEKKSKGENEKVSEELIKKRPPLDPVSFHLYLLEKTLGVLGGQNYDLQYPAGGGLLDYRALVPESRDGTFHMRIKFDQEMDPKDLHVFYLSNAKVRQVEGKPMGNGCGKYFDITKFWNKSMAGDGLTLNTAKFRHISITAGVLFFVASVKGKIRIAHLTVRDSRHRDLLCTSSNQ